MKRKIIAIGIVAVLIVVSFYFGMVYGRTQIASKDVSINTVYTTALLNSLHAGDTNRVVRSLGSWLDVNVVAIGTWRDVPFSKPYRKQMDRALSRAAHYRKEHPREPLYTAEYNPETVSPEWEKAVQKQAAFAEEFNQTMNRLLSEAKPLDEPGQQSPGAYSGGVADVPTGKAQK